MISKQEQAEFLAEAMPYIKKYNDKILVIKYGGNAMINEELKTSVMRDLVLLQLVGIKVVLVHGAAAGNFGNAQTGRNRKSVCQRASVYRCRDGGNRPYGVGRKNQ